MTDWATTGDPDLLAWENACHLADALNVVLTRYKVRERTTGQAPDIEEEAYFVTSDADVVLGQRGRRVPWGKRQGQVAFTYAQVCDMAGLLGEMLPELARNATEARKRLNRGR